MDYGLALFRGTCSDSRARVALVDFEASVNCPEHNVQMDDYGCPKCAELDAIAESEAIEAEEIARMAREAELMTPEGAQRFIESVDAPDSTGPYKVLEAIHAFARWGRSSEIGVIALVSVPSEYYPGQVERVIYAGSWSDSGSYDQPPEGENWLSVLEYVEDAPHEVLKAITEDDCITVMRRLHELLPSASANLAHDSLATLRDLTKPGMAIWRGSRVKPGGHPNLFVLCAGLKPVPAPETTRGVLDDLLTRGLIGGPGAGSLFGSDESRCWMITDRGRSALVWRACDPV